MTILSLKSESTVVSNDASAAKSAPHAHLFDDITPAEPTAKKRRKHKGNQSDNDASFELEPVHEHLFDNITKRKKDPKKVLKAKTAKWKNSHIDMVGYLDNLSRQREEWEENAYKTSNQQLYRILGSCLDIYMQMKGRGQALVHQRDKLDEALNALGLPFTDGTSLATKIVRFVFRSDRKRSYTYSRVILSAFENKQDALSLPGWISQQGGVEEVRRKSTNAISPSLLNAQYQEQAKEFLHSATGFSSRFKTVKELEANDEANSRFIVAIIRENGDGTSSIVFGIDNKAIVNGALAFAGKQLAVKSAENKANDNRRKVKSRRSEILEMAS